MAAGFVQSCCFDASDIMTCLSVACYLQNRLTLFCVCIVAVGVRVPPRCPLVALSGRVTALMNVRFEGNNGHDAYVMRCLLMTQSGHRRD